jgi:hypothetical protein
MGYKEAGRITSLAGLVILSLLAGVFSSACSSGRKEAVMPPPPTVEPAKVDPWKEAASKIEEDRGEPIGRKAEVHTPDELKHYADRRRFLAMQVAETREQDYKLPHDYAELVEMIRGKSLVEMEPLGEDYILYGVGANASDDAFAHYDEAEGENVPLFASDEDFKEEYDRLTKLINEPQSRVARLEGEIRKLKKRDRVRRNALQTEIAELRKKASPAIARRKLIESYSKNPEKRETLVEEWRLVSGMAADLGGKAYDLSDPPARKQFKVRLLSFLRPEARNVLLEIARDYRAKFDRPLPITSLVRPEQYQRRLGETNPNATRISSPPHATGLAFDIFYFYMTADEQDYLMSLIAKLKADGRVEALRENRNHIHVFAFPDGQRPDESLVAQAMGETASAKPQKQQPSKQARGKKGAKESKLARSGKSRKGSTARAASSRNKKGKPVAQARGRRSGRSN